MIILLSGKEEEKYTGIDRRSSGKYTQNLMYGATLVYVCIYQDDSFLQISTRNITFSQFVSQ